MQLSKVFEKRSRDDTTSPMHSAIEWAKLHCLQDRHQNDCDVDEAEKQKDSSVSGLTASLRKEMTPMFVITECYPAPWNDKHSLRRFMATTFESFVDFYRNKSSVGYGDSERMCHEVIPEGPCKAYLDLEIKCDAKTLRERQDFFANADAAAKTLIDRIVELHDTQYNVRVVPVILVSHHVPANVLTPSKWSKHIVFKNSLWATAVHFGKFAKAVVAELTTQNKLISEIFDSGVYARTRSMRMYRSCKLEQRGRSFLFESGPPEHKAHENEISDDFVSANLLLDTMITAIPLPVRRKKAQTDLGDVDTSSDSSLSNTGHKEQRLDAEHDVVTRKFVSTEFLIQYPRFVELFGLQPLTFTKQNGGADAGNDSFKTTFYTNSARTEMLKRTGVLSDSTDDTESIEEHRGKLSALDKLFEVVCHMKASASPYMYQMPSSRGIMRVECHSKQCPFTDREHGSNHIFLLVDFLSRKIATHCYHPRCRTKRTQWISVTDNEQFANASQNLFVMWRGALKLNCLARVCPMLATSYAENTSNL